MIKLFGQKTEKPAQSAAKKMTAAELRLQKGCKNLNVDIEELSVPSNITVDFPDPDDLMNFNVSISPDEGLYFGGKFNFTFAMKSGYPHDPPKVKCTQTIYHPNIDLEGNVCLNILREDWKPVLSLNSIIYGLQYLFLEPNPEDPLNKEAAQVLRDDKYKFGQKVKSAMSGRTLDGIRYDLVLQRQ